MSLARAAALVTLVVSLGANAFFAQALGRRSAPPAQPEPIDEEPAAAPAASKPAPAVRPVATGQSAGAATGASLQQVRCAAELSSLQESMAQRSEALRGVLPPQPLFARGQANPEAERVLTPIVAQVAARGGAEGKPTLECRDVACKLTFTAPAALDDDAWDQVLANNADFQGWSQQFTFGPAAPVPGGKLVQRSVFFKLNGPRAVAAQAALVPGRTGR